jgi:hypothetical protein
MSRSCSNYFCYSRVDRTAGKILQDRANSKSLATIQILADDNLSKSDKIIKANEAIYDVKYKAVGLKFNLAELQSKLRNLKSDSNTQFNIFKNKLESVENMNNYEILKALYELKKK